MVSYAHACHIVRNVIVCNVEIMLGQYLIFHIVIPSRHYPPVYDILTVFLKIPFPYFEMGIKFWQMAHAQAQFAETPPTYLIDFIGR